MNNQEQFNWSVNVLAKAYLEGVLEPMSCAACACGNLVAAANNFTVIKRPYEGCTWLELFPQGARPAAFTKMWYESTVYTISQLKYIEAAFMNWSAPNTPYKEVDMRQVNDPDHFYALMRVVDVLADIHQIDLTEANQAKLLFQKV